MLIMSKVNLIALSKPNATTDCNTAEELVAYAARVSNPANQSNKETAPKLLKYLIKENHWSPFEMVHMTLEITTTRDIAKQILRHRSFSFQEFSQRYAKASNFVERECRMQDPKNRQNSIELDEHPLFKTGDRIAEDWNMKQRDLIRRAKELYDWALDKGIAKEQARAVLPEGLTKTRLYMTGTVRSWIHYVDVRTTNGTQKEHADIARECGYEINSIFPMIKDFIHE